MATARTICTRALRRLRVPDALQAPAAEDAVTALDALNEMLQRWRSKGVDCLPQTFQLDDELSIFVPPDSLSAETIAAVTLAGTWDASANSPALASGAGTDGYAYRVTTAGSTTLDNLSTWSVGDFAVFDGLVWRKGKSPSIHQGAIVDLLAVRIADEFGISPSDMMRRDAISGWQTLLNDYVRPPEATFDSALLITSARRAYETF